MRYFNLSKIIHSSASYQIEGAWNVDGKLPSIWDTATHRLPNDVADGSTGDDAAKSYYYLDRDIALLKDVDVIFSRGLFTCQLTFYFSFYQ